MNVVSDRFYGVNGNSIPIFSPYQYLVTSSQQGIRYRQIHSPNRFQNAIQNRGRGDVSGTFMLQLFSCCYNG